jgi:hypothetical protein
MIKEEVPLRYANLAKDVETVEIKDVLEGIREKDNATKI